jgi:hypothetical protein
MDWINAGFLAGGIMLGIIIAIVGFFALLAFLQPGPQRQYEPRSPRRSVYFDPKKGPPWNRKPPIP